jgi:hypothetical protein
VDAPEFNNNYFLVFISAKRMDLKLEKETDKEEQETENNRRRKKGV